MEILTKTRAVGGSLVVTLPANIVKSEMLSEGELVEISVKKRRRNFFGMLKGAGKFTEEDRMKDRE
jgi:antitoxin component of MazEF toxin-antitoxin module